MATRFISWSAICQTLKTASKETLGRASGLGFADALEDAGFVAVWDRLRGGGAQEVYGGFEGVDEGGAGGTFG